MNILFMILASTCGLAATFSYTRNGEEVVKQDGPERIALAIVAFMFAYLAVNWGK